MKTVTVENFTSDFGIRIRRLVNSLLRRVLKVCAKRKLIVEEYPTLPPNKPYIFASTHSFDEDVISNLVAIDRNAWILFGTTNQLEYNRQVYAAWLNGLIYIDRCDTESRRSSVEKMERILRSGSSVLMFPEGGYNNSENLLVQKLFAGAYTVARDTNTPVIPVAVFNEYNADTVYIYAGKPLDLGKLEKNEALQKLRDEMGALTYRAIERHTTPLKRDELKGDLRMRYMEERRKVYYDVSWSKDVWDEEITVYKDKITPDPEDMRKFIDTVEITPTNAHILAPILVEHEIDKKYDFKAYMHRTFKANIL